MSGFSADTVRVVVRVRPLLPREAPAKCVTVHGDARSLTIGDGERVDGHEGGEHGGARCGRRGGSGSHTFAFDHVYGEESSQAELYETTARPVVESCLEGYNATIFAYGQTGTGKTSARTASGKGSRSPRPGARPVSSPFPPLRRVEPARPPLGIPWTATARPAARTAAASSRDPSRASSSTSPRAPTATRAPRRGRRRGAAADSGGASVAGAVPRARVVHPDLPGGGVGPSRGIAARRARRARRGWVRGRGGRGAHDPRGPEARHLRRTPRGIPTSFEMPFNVSVPERIFKNSPSPGVGELRGAFEPAGPDETAVPRVRFDEWRETFEEFSEGPQTGDRIPHRSNQSEERTLLFTSKREGAPDEDPYPEISRRRDRPSRNAAAVDRRPRSGRDAGLARTEDRGTESPFPSRRRTAAREGDARLPAQVENLSEHVVHGPVEVYRLMDRAAKARRPGAVTRDSRKVERARAPAGPDPRDLVGARDGRDADERRVLAVARGLRRHCRAPARTGGRAPGGAAGEARRGGRAGEADARRSAGRALGDALRRREGPRDDPRRVRADLAARGAQARRSARAP